MHSRDSTVFFGIHPIQTGDTRIHLLEQRFRLGFKNHQSIECGWTNGLKRVCDPKGLFLMIQDIVLLDAASNLALLAPRGLLDTVSRGHRCGLKLCDLPVCRSGILQDLYTLMNQVNTIAELFDLLPVKKGLMKLLSRDSP